MADCRSSITRSVHRIHAERRSDCAGLQVALAHGRWFSAAGIPLRSAFSADPSNEASLVRWQIINAPFAACKPGSHHAPPPPSGRSKIWYRLQGCRWARDFRAGRCSPRRQRILRHRRERRYLRPWSKSAAYRCNQDQKDHAQKDVCAVFSDQAIKSHAPKPDPGGFRGLKWPGKFRPWWRYWRAFHSMFSAQAMGDFVASNGRQNCSEGPL